MKMSNLKASTTIQFDAPRTNKTALLENNTKVF